METIEQRAELMLATAQSGGEWAWRSLVTELLAALRATDARVALLEKDIESHSCEALAGGALDAQAEAEKRMYAQRLLAERFRRALEALRKDFTDHSSDGMTRCMSCGSLTYTVGAEPYHHETCPFVCFNSSEANR